MLASPAASVITCPRSTGPACSVKRIGGADVLEEEQPPARDQDPRDLRCQDGIVAAVSAWSLVHGLSALWISGRLSERIAEQDPHRLAAAVSDLFVEAVLPPPEGSDA
jgi:hypothetical protein